MRSEDYYRTKSLIFGALIEAIDLTQLSRLDGETAREEIRDIVTEIIGLKNIVLSIAEQEELLDDICNDVLGYGPLEPLLARDDIADIMVNGANRTFIEVSGKIQLTNVRFRDNQQLMNICQRIVSQVGRRVDDASPICDARLPDGSRVNVIAPPLAIDGPALTIRKFKKDKLTLEQLVRFGAISPEGAEVLKIIGQSRCNVVISGGTGSGKTTLLNCLTAFIEHDERVITCEDAAELQLQQPHVVRLETRPPNMEGQGQVTMRDLVKNCLRMRPERIIVGEVRGPEAFDLLQAMNTGHDGSMGTLHANSPRECLSRIESMISMGGFTLPSKTLREMICGSIDVVIQADPPARRLAAHHPHHRGARDGGRRHHHAGHLPLRHRRRGRERQADRAPPLHRHRPAEILGARPLLRPGTPARRGARRRRSRRPDLSAARPMPDLAAATASNLPIAAGLIGIAVAAVAYVAVLPLLGGERRATKRLKAIGVSASGAAIRGVAVNRREQVAKTLSEIEAKAKGAVEGHRRAEARPGRPRLDQADLLHPSRRQRRASSGCCSS